MTPDCREMHLAPGDQLPFWISRLIWVTVLMALSAWFVTCDARVCVKPSYSSSWFDADPMSFTGFVAVIVGIGYSIAVDRNQMHLLSQWNDAAIIDLKPADRAVIEHSLCRWSLVWQLLLGSLFPVVMLISYIIVFDSRDLLSEFSIASFVCAFLVGLRIARLISHGRLGRSIVRLSVPFELTIGHPDRAGGTAQIGTFYFLQASVLITPVLWLLIWILPIRALPEYPSWTAHHSYFLVIALVVFILAFLLPMLAFRRIIRDWKHENYPIAVSNIKKELLKLREIRTPNLIQRQRQEKTAQQLDSLISLPDWPVSPTMRNIFVTTFMLPLIANVVAFIANIVTTSR